MFDLADITIKKSRRARHVRLTVKTDGTVVLTQPYFMPTDSALKFVHSKHDWIAKTVAYYKKADILPIPKPSKRDFDKYKREARLLVLEKIRVLGAPYRQAYGNEFSIKKVSIKNQKSRWGSCSKNGNLNFSYRIVFLPEHLQDYLIVHELCHLKVFNHSAAFWALVRETIPLADIKEFRRRVR
jgi:predicted metal-dependent hydrolase